LLGPYLRPPRALSYARVLAASYRKA
jgi:hypothetical protein